MVGHAIDYVNHNERSPALHKKLVGLILSLCPKKMKNTLLAINVVIHFPLNEFSKDNPV